MTYLTDPKNYTPVELAAFVAALPLNGWKPKFITLHNTASPTLKEWGETEGARHQRVVNLNAMYKNVDHWHSGVHLFCDQYPDGIWNACDLRADGISVSCWNRVTMGIEMVGNYATPNELRPKLDPPADDWKSAAGHAVRDNAVAAAAILHNHFGLRPDGYVKGVKGLHFHRECPADHHLCPGGQVDKADIVARILAKMDELKAAA